MHPFEHSQRLSSPSASHSCVHACVSMCVLTHTHTHMHGCTRSAQPSAVPLQIIGTAPTAAVHTHPALSMLPRAARGRSGHCCTCMHGRFNACMYACMRAALGGWLLCSSRTPWCATGAARQSAAASAHRSGLTCVGLCWA